MARDDDAGPHARPDVALVDPPVVMVVDDSDPDVPAGSSTRPHPARADEAHSPAAPIVMDVDGSGPAAEGPGPADRVRRPPWLVPTVAVVLVVLLALGWWGAVDDDASPPTAWSAPVAPVVERWHLGMSSLDDGPAQVVPVGDDVLLRRGRGQPGSSRRVGLERRDGRTGEVVWSTDGLSDALVVVLDGDRPLPRLLHPVDRVRAVVGIDGATGERLWRRPGNDSRGGVTSAGELWLAGDRGCGLAHAPTGRMLFTVGGDGPEGCAPAGDGLVFRNGDELVVVDRTGTVVDRLTMSRGTQVTWPLVLDGATMFLDGRDLVVREPSGVQRWRRDLGAGPAWWWMQPVGADLLSVAGARQTVLVDRRDGAVVARVDGQVGALVTTDGRVRLVADRSRTSPAEASGVWSRSPDATDIALLDERGEVLGTQELVVGSWPIPTAQGLLLVHGPDDRRRLGLFDPDDLSARWQLPLSLRDGEVVASSEAVVVVDGVRDGRHEVVVFGPEG